MRGPLVIKIVGSSAEPERTVTALSVAGAADAAGVAVSLWLAGDAVWLAVANERRTALQPDSGAAANGSDLGAEAGDLFEAILTGAGAAVCARCAARRCITEQDLVAGARIAGAAAFVTAATEPGAQALVY